MRVEANESCPMPQDPILAEVAAALQNTRGWGWLVDRDWRLVFMTDEHRRGFSGGAAMVPTAIDEHLFGPEMGRVSTEWRIGPNNSEIWGEILEILGGLVLADASGGKDELRTLVDSSLSGIVNDLSPVDSTAVSGSLTSAGIRIDTGVSLKAIRIRDESGDLRGTMLSFTPEPGLNLMMSTAFEMDPDHLKRMTSFARAGRRPAAIFFADLEGSSALARRLSTGGYFALGRRIVRATDQCVVDAGGLVGRHVGDGVVAFFPVESFESESGAARACISAARAVQVAMRDVAARSDLATDDLVTRFGLHWGSTLFIGNISTAARSEVTALGDEVNEAARIEACATGGRILASKPLIERLGGDDAAALDIDPDHVTYTQLADLDTATEKARRDAPSIAVCTV